MDIPARKRKRLHSTNDIAKNLTFTIKVKSVKAGEYTAPPKTDKTDILKKKSTLHDKERESCYTI
jgi:hypothetical protein